MLTRGRIEPDKPTLVRMHGSILPPTCWVSEAAADYVPAALQTLAAMTGVGGRIPARSQPGLAFRAYGAAEMSVQRDNALRDYGLGAQILLDLGVRE